MLANVFVIIFCRIVPIVTEEDEMDGVLGSVLISVYFTLFHYQCFLFF